MEATSETAWTEIGKPGDRYDAFQGAYQIFVRSGQPLVLRITPSQRDPAEVSFRFTPVYRPTNDQVAATTVLASALPCESEFVTLALCTAEPAEPVPSLMMRRLDGSPGPPPASAGLYFLG